MSAVACHHCGQEVPATKRRATYCSKLCQNRAWHASQRVERPVVTTECHYCGQEIIMNAAHTRRYCSARCRGLDHRLRAAEAVS